MAKKTQKTPAPVAPAPVAPASVLPTVSPVAIVQPATVAAPAAPAPAGFRPAAFPPTARVTIKADGNPKRPGTQAARAWGAYSDANGKPLRTVAEVLARFAELRFPKRYARSALRWDAGHGFIEIAAS